MDSSTVVQTEAYELLESGQGNSKTICAAITRLGKPFEGAQVNTVAPTVAKYLHHEDFLVRYQAIWFLGCWGRLPDYVDSIVLAAKEDSDLDNRAFAARCVGRSLKKHANESAALSLLHMVLDRSEAPEVRLGAYSSLIFAYKKWNSRKEASQFEPIGDKSIKDIDDIWLTELEAHLRTA